MALFSGNARLARTGLQHALTRRSQLTEDHPGPAASRTSAAGNCQKITSRVAAPAGNRMGRYLGKDPGIG